MATTGYAGARVRISTEDGIYEGNIHLVDFNNKKLSLERVVVVSSGKRLQGLQNFYGNELESLDLLEEGPLIKANHAEDKRSGKGQSILDKGHKYTPPHLKNLRRRDEGVPMETSSGEDDETVRCNTPGSTKSDYDSGIDQEAVQKGRSRFAFTVLDKVREQLFSDACVFGLSVEPYCGALCCGSGSGRIEIGRGGELCWLQVATPDHVFLFDVKTMGPQCFSEGLKEILENGRILKVMHNCRLPSDMLWHKYGVNLVNIFDTQVADVFVYRNSHGSDWPRYVQGLAIVLLDYLPLSRADVHIRRVRKGCVEEDSAFWAERPASPQVLDAAVKDVVYLRELRRVLMEKMMMEYTAGVDIFLNNVRDATSTEAQKMKESSHLLPVTFNHLSHLTYQSKIKNQPHKIDKDPNGFVENFRTFDKSLFFNQGGPSSLDKGKPEPKSDLIPPGCDDQERLPVEPLPRNLSTECSTDKGAQATGSPKGQDLPGEKIAAGRGSIISRDTAFVIPGTGQYQSQEPAKTGPCQSDNLDSSQTKPSPNESLESNESDRAHVPVWSSLIEPQTSDLSGLILKPPGVQEKMKKTSNRQNDAWPDGKRVHQNLVESYPQDTGTFECSDPSLSLTRSEDLEKNCFDVIPSGRFQAKSVSCSVEPCLDLHCVIVGDMDTSVPVQEAGKPLSCPDSQVTCTSDTGALGKVSSGTVPYGSKVGRTRFSDPSLTGTMICNVNIPCPYTIESHVNARLENEHSPGDVLCLSGAVSEGILGSSHFDQLARTGQGSYLPGLDLWT
ncbi:piRNA biogenesis protein EXD1-like [Liolophura sinensis]|uniref:piRNA biogenesis protein EXD1-like n=1 Tax=Liolophura sinensis TaxID=3198878 RepID=UPI00315949AB